MYFADENALGLGKLLRRSGRSDIVYPGHEDFPQVPLGLPDTDWMRIVADSNLVVLTRDRRIRTRPAERRAFHELGMRAVWLGAKRDLSPGDQLEMFLRHENRLRHEIVKRGPGPWGLKMTPSGLRPLRLIEP